MFHATVKLTTILYQHDGAFKVDEYPATELKFD